MDRLVGFLVRYRKINALVTIAVVLLFSLFSLRLGFENSVESFFPKDDPDLVYYNTGFKKQFGDDQTILVAIPMGEVFTRQSLVALDGLCKALKKLPSVRKVRSITEAQDIVGNPDGFEVKKFLKTIPDDPAELARLRDAALANPMYQTDLISKDARIACIVIECKYSEREDRYKQLTEEVRSALENSFLKGRLYYAAGDPLIELQMTRDMWGDLFRITPLSFVGLGILLWLIFRSWRPVLTQLAVMGLCSAWQVGFLGLMRWPINTVTVGLPALVLVITVLKCIFVVALYRIELEATGDRVEATRLAIRRVLFPTFIANLTTALGFAANAATSLVPVAEFGWAGAAATMMSFAIVFLTLPWFVSLLPADSVRATEGEQRGMERVFAFLQRSYERRTLLAIVFGVIAVAAVVGVSRIRVETNHLNFLRASNPVKQAADYIEQNVGGATPLEITVEAGEEGGIQDPRVLRQIEALEAYMKTLPRFVKSLSPVAFIKMMNRAFHEGKPSFYSIPDSKEVVAQYLLTYTLSGRDNDMDDFVDFSYKVARIRGRTAERSSVGLREMFRKIDAFARTHFDPDVRVRVTSHSLLITNMVGSMVRGQLTGVAVLTVMMFLIFAITFRSVTIGVAALVPNVLPLLIELGLMGFIGATLNVGTAITVCITFGLVVDGTVFMVHQMRIAFREENDPRKVVRQMLELRGSPVIITAGLLAFGFSLMAIGRCLLTVYFGLLCAFTIVVALLCDLFLTPYMTIHLAPFRRALMKRGVRKGQEESQSPAGPE